MTTDDAGQWVPVEVAEYVADMNQEEALEDLFTSVNRSAVENSDAYGTLSGSQQAVVSSYIAAVDGVDDIDDFYDQVQDEGLELVYIDPAELGDDGYDPTGDDPSSGPDGDGPATDPSGDGDGDHRHYWDGDDVDHRHYWDSEDPVGHVHRVEIDGLDDLYDALSGDISVSVEVDGSVDMDGTVEFEGGPDYDPTGGDPTSDPSDDDYDTDPDPSDPSDDPSTDPDDPSTDPDDPSTDPDDPSDDDPVYDDLDISIKGLEGEDCADFSGGFLGGFLSRMNKPSVNEYAIEATGDDVDEIDSFRVSKLDRGRWTGSTIGLSDYDIGSMYSETEVDVSGLDRNDIFSGDYTMFSGFDPEVYDSVPAHWNGTEADGPSQDVLYRVEALDADGNVMDTTDFHNMEVEGYGMPDKGEVQDKWKSVTGMMPLLTQYHDDDLENRGLVGGAKKAREEAIGSAKDGFFGNLLPDIVGHKIASAL